MKPLRPPEAHTPAVQYAALPWRRGAEGVEILLVSSRETRRWVIPKGWPMQRREPHAAAAREALEEGGIQGLIDAVAIGHYPYQKRLKRGIEVAVLVEVFPLEVRRERKKWPEKNQRTRQWFTPQAAADAVDEPELKALILAFARSKAN